VVSEGAGTTDGAATRNGGTGMTGRLAITLLAALSLFAFQLAHAQSSSAATGVPCLQTGMETVTTDRSAYAPGSLVHVSGTGYAFGCDVVVKVTRPDGAVVVGDGSQTPGSDTATTDLAGNFSYDYQLPIMPPVEGQYLIDVLGSGDVVLAHTDFFDAQIVETYSDPARTNIAELFQLSRGDTVYSKATGLNTGKSYEFQVLDPSNTVKQTSACVSPPTSNELSDSYVLQPSDPLSGTNGWTYRLLTWNNSNSNCTGPPNASPDFSSFFVARVSTFSNAALTIPKSSFAAGQTVYVQVAGFKPNVANSPGNKGVSIFWLKPGETTSTATCKNTNGGDRAASSSNGLTPSGGGQYFRYAPDPSETDNWNQLASYDTATTAACPALAPANAGQWKIALQDMTGGQGNAPGVLDAFTVDTTKPTVTINQAGTQNDPTNGSPINFTVVFSESVTGFTACPAPRARPPRPSPAPAPPTTSPSRG
jgi:hypothetical protein